MRKISSLNFVAIGMLAMLFLGCSNENSSLQIPISKNQHIALIGNNLCARMLHFGYFETEMHLRFPEHQLFIRNMCDGGDTPGFRPHSGRYSPWAFQGAEKFQNELANFSNSQGHFETPDQWLSRLKTDIILAFFGYNESFAGEAGLANFEGELEAFIQHTVNQTYNDSTAPQLILVSPIAFQDLSKKMDLPDGKKENENLKLYTEAMRRIAAENDISFLDVFSPTKKWMAGEQLTNDGFQLNDAGYQKFSKYLVDHIFEKKTAKVEEHRTMVLEAVLEKNWFWHDDYKSPNGVHVFGRRYNPFGPQNYPDEIKKKREMTALRDQAIWKATQGEKMNLATADAQTHPLPEVPTNFKIGDYGRGIAKYLYGGDAEKTLTTPAGYRVELFASEKEFPDLANPVQMSFDNKGRLWVAVMPTYPHYRPGDPKPNDKLIILEDTDGDYKADRQTIFVEGLHIPAGFEFAPEGVYVSQGTHLKLYTDTDGDDRADREEIILSGFDDHDTHHVISAFCADPSGAMYMGEGVFLHTNVETPYGPVRATNGGFFRYSPQRKHLERAAQIPIPNPWGIAFDEYGQCIFAETSGPNIQWMLPSTTLPRYGQHNEKSPVLLGPEQMVRPTSGLEFVSSRHFPEEVQGDLLVNNTIGFLGMKQHQMLEDSTGFWMEYRQDLVKGSDPNFRPVDMEFAPDGSLYFIDWHNVLIGHMQHNARDPLRDHVHGRVYRITYPARPLVTPAEVSGASVSTLLENLKLPEYRTRYRTRRELRGRDAEEVLAALAEWVKQLDAADEKYEHHLLEALWVTWGLNQVDQNLCEKLLTAKDHRVRAAVVEVLRYAGHEFKNRMELLEKAATDSHGRVRLAALAAGSWLAKEDALKVLEKVAEHPLDRWIKKPYEKAMAHVKGENLNRNKNQIRTHLKGAEKELFVKGKELYEREAYCETCHQTHGQGLAAAGYPPLKNTQWVTGDEERLIKMTLQGVYGPMTVLNRKYEGNVPMTAFGKLMDDEEVAAVLTFVRNSFGNRATPISPEKVKAVREAIQGKEGFYTAEELLEEHPFPKRDM